MSKFLTVLIYALLIIVMLFSASLVVPAYRKNMKEKEDVARLTEERDRKNAEVLSLQAEVHDLEHNASAIEKVAREKYRLCREGETIFIYSE